MASPFRWLAPAALALGLGAASLAAPQTARADDELVRVIVDVADVIFRGGTPYYRHGGYGPHDRLVIVHDRYGRPHYYRYVDHDRYDRYDRYDRGYRYGPPYGRAHGHYGKRGKYRRQYCDSRGRCRVEYYDPRYDRRRDDRYGVSYPYRHWRGD